MADFVGSFPLEYEQHLELGKKHLWKLGECCGLAHHDLQFLLLWAEKHKLLVSVGANDFDCSLEVLAWGSAA